MTKKMRLLTNMTLAATTTSWMTCAQDHTVFDALASSTISGNILVRYEHAAQDNSLMDANALTARSLFDFKTGEFQGLSAVLTLENTTALMGINEYSVPQTGYKKGEYSVIADPEHTEIDQAYINYRSDALSVKLGRQMIIMNNHRMVGHVGWRNDRQTFDALSLNYTFDKGIMVDYSYIDQRNRIFATDADVDSADHLLNVSFDALGGNVKTYGILLSDSNSDLDTYGFSYSRKQIDGDITWAYFVDLATQRSIRQLEQYNANYLHLSLSATVNGKTFTLAHERLGTDDGQYGFSTPLATLHKFNGTADVFLATPKQGLDDSYLSIAGHLGNGRYAATYHSYAAVDSSPTISKLGQELDLQYTATLFENYKLGLKYAYYVAGDSKVDTQKYWMWISRTF